ncbi:hypothetical protein JRF84_31630 [Methylobacterium organophilum]|jgi:hypothetical protein|uniref:hypothetical protein n=1 Tax=Methylobacterium organophilum TaxID=410 RepID=UPI0019D03FD0|nr:hypothetical protein [Methylobacterium organophilum]MBN6824119.1 hypothetical protein [Methylobacterium organophilum]
MTTIRPIENADAKLALAKTSGPLGGEPWWVGRQWAVTSYGIEALDGSYPIEASRFAEDLPQWSWIRQLGEKEWCDLADFVTAYMVAIALHGSAPAVGRDQILDDYRLALRDRKA